MKPWPLAVLGCVAALLSGVTQAQVALPEAVARTAPWQLVGSGEMVRFVFRVYEASLWQSGRTQALAIRYARDIPGTTLADTTVEELRRLGLADAEHWRGPLLNYFPDVAEGDVIVAVKPHDAGVRFYYQGRRTGAIADAEFADTFFGIWLDRRTREPALRASLLGETAR